MAILRIKDNDGNEYEIPAIKGTEGRSAYRIALDNGFEGTEIEWLESLRGEQGQQGEKGDPATNIIQSVNGKIGVVQLSASDVGALSEDSIDTQLDESSSNPLANKAVFEAINAFGVHIPKVDQSFDSETTPESKNAQSGKAVAEMLDFVGEVWTSELEKKADKSEIPIVDIELSENSPNPLANSAVFAMMQAHNENVTNNFQTKTIIDAGEYFTYETVEGALQEIGATLNGLEEFLASI